MTKSEYQEYLNSERWKNLRLELLTQTGNRCARCEIPRWLAEIVYDQDLHVHHRSYAHLGTSEEIGDLEPLCRRCHEIETFGRTSLREFRSFPCSVCEQAHWNRYSDKCPFCEHLLISRNGFMNDLFEVKTSGGFDLGSVILFGICQRFGLDKVTVLATRFWNAITADNIKGVVQ